MARIPEDMLVEYLAALVRDLAGDIGGFDLRRGRQPKLARRMRPHLLAACHELIASRRALRVARDPYLERQCRSVLGQCSGDHHEQPLKIQLGGGPVRLKGWVNFGFAPADVVLDLRWGLPLPKGCASFVFCAHVLEHLDYPEGVRDLLVEARRVLRPGGVLRLIVPDMKQYLNAYAGSDHGFLWRFDNYWRLEERDGGVYVQVESVTLSRGVPDDVSGTPVAVRKLVSPLYHDSEKSLTCPLSQVGSNSTR